MLQIQNNLTKEDNMSKSKLKSKRRRFRAPKSTLATNCRVVLSNECDASIASAFVRHVPKGNITTKTK